MKGLVLYCIGSSSSALPGDVRGAQESGLLFIAQGELAAVVSPGAESRRGEAPTAAELLAYERVIHSQHAVADVVPMRFGSVLSDEAAVRAHLDAQRATYLRVLARVSGCVEMGVRVLVPPSAPPAAREVAVKPAGRSGTAYLKALRQRHSAENQQRNQCEALEQELLSRVAPLCREHRVELSPLRLGEPALCSLYFLVPRGEVPVFRASVSTFAQGRTVEVSLSGPWPPFNFVD
jgi:hypothetical protein